jgi:glycerol-3-phosphate dehydrogenase
MVSIIGGKLTTWRKMGEDAVNHLAARDGQPRASITRRMPLAGAADRHAIAVLASEAPVLAARIVPDLPYIMAEVVHACRHEMALTLDDVLSRRTRLVLEDRAQGMGVAHAVAALMAAELGWDNAETERQVRAYEERVRREYREQRV